MIDLLERSATAWSIDELDVTGLEWLDDRTLHVHGWRGTRSARGTVGRDGDHASIVVDEDVLREPTIGRAAGPVDNDRRDGARRRSRPRRRRLRRGAAGRTVGAAPPVEALELSVDELRWSATDGTELHGLLLTRADADRGTGVPVLHLHGGPANLWTRAASAGAAALAWSGYAVILPNPRGSVGRGQAFARANLGDPGGRELDDALAAVAMCRRAGPRRRPRPGGRRRFLRRLPDRSGGRAPPRSRGRRGDVRPPRPRQRSLREQQPGVLRHPPRGATGRRDVRPLPRSVARVPRPPRRATDADPARRRRPLHPGRTGRRAVPRPARARRAGRARRVPRRGTRPAVSRRPARRLGANDRLVRSATCGTGRIADAADAAWGATSVAGCSW